jgi:hypothetical protein
VTSLRELQLAFVDGALHDYPARICSMIRDNGVEPQRRLAIYRNNVREGFLKTLTAMFPTVVRLAGEHWFRQTGCEYLRRHPSRSGNLHNIGERFAALLDDDLRATAYGYFTDVARLEWAYQEVLVSDDRPPLAASALASVAAEDYESLIFETHPALRLVESNYPIFAIWKANRSETIDASAAISLDDGPSRVLIIRRTDHVELRELGAGEFALLSAFAADATLGAAANAALLGEPDLDLGAALARVLELETLVAFSIRPARPPACDIETCSLIAADH